ncbi:MAG TPA: GNAT family protein [Chloroflexia bacterium]|nr:GNAT family protein [Chloroflexia bacterium]
MQPGSEKPKEPLLSVRGEKVGLGAWLPEHFEAWMEAIHDPETNIYSDGGFVMPDRQREAHLLEETTRNGGANFAIYALPEERFVGLCGLFKVDQKRGTATFGITIIDKAYWGKGYGTEAARLTLDFGFRFLNLHNIMLDTTEFNQRAIRAYQKAGFKLIGRRRQANPLAGKRYDQVFMDCLATEFEPPTPGWFRLPDND